MFPDFPEMPPLMMVLAIAFFAYVLYHWRKRPPVAFDMPPKEAVLFEEHFASGYSLRDLVVRFGGASNCLHIVVTADALYVRPTFPFSLFGYLLDLSHHVPKWRLVTMNEKSSLFSDGWEITYQHNDGGTSRFYIDPKDDDGLKHALRNAGFLPAERLAANA